MYFTDYIQDLQQSGTGIESFPSLFLSVTFLNTDRGLIKRKNSKPYCFLKRQCRGHLTMFAFEVTTAY